MKKALVFSSLSEVEPSWLSFADGVDYFHGKIAAPQFEFYALRIDLVSANNQIVVKDGMAGAERSLSTKVSGFVRDNNLIAGINAVPFDVVSSTEGQPIKNIGIVISDGELLAPANRHYDALVFYNAAEAQRAAIVSQSSISSTGNIENAVGGFYHILVEGNPSQRTLNDETRHPRSAAGLSPDSKHLFLLVIDGRRAGSVGATVQETALVLRSLGSSEGINFDGGGSSALAMSFPDGRVRVVNTPIHNGIPGQERAVAGCIGVR
ncbi:MAG: phosphodiester glycosidase family protein [Treponema sp.]|nr:phosphodiester glycosidase family protein [Treponema sp.]